MAIKRITDIIIAIIGMALLIPVYAVAATAIKTDSSGPVIFKQERVGKDGRKFIMYKFRTMAKDAENGVGHKWAETNDPRLTKAGRILKEYWIDEMPQFINVLKGEMSIAGPRPEMSGLVPKLMKEIPHYEKRLKVKPGMTGLAQVHGFYGNTSLKERVKYDLEYIKRQSLLLDMKIMLETAKMFFKKLL